MPITTNSKMTATTPTMIHSIAHSPRLPLRHPALSKRNGGAVAMIERPNVDTLLAGPLGEWLARQAVVRAEAKAKSNRRFMIAGIIAAPLLGLIWLGQFF